MKYLFLFGLSFLGFLMIPLKAGAAGPTLVNVAQSIHTPTTWTLEESPYIVQGFGQLRVTSDLTIEPGVVVKFQPTRSNGRYNSLGAVDGGSIIANGTEDQPIIFTSSHDDTAGGDTNLNGGNTLPEPGDWYGVLLQDDASSFSHTIIRYAGNGRATSFATRGSMDIRGHSRAVITDTTIAEGDSHGVVVDDPAIPTLARLTIEGHADYGISSTITSNPVTVRESLIRNNRRGALSMSPATSLRFSETVFTGGTPQIVELSNATDAIDRDTRWQYIPGLTYVNRNPGRIFVESGKTLTIEPGVAMKWGRTSGLFVAGQLQAEATEDLPIVFTSYRDDTAGGDTNFDNDMTLPTAGDWGGIYFENATGSLASVRLQYGGLFQDDFGGILYGFNIHHLLHLAASAVTMHDVTIERAYDTAIFVTGDSRLALADSRIGYSPRGMEVFGDQGFSMRNNAFASTSVFALRNNGQGQIDARENWWGSDIGPRPRGQGELVIGNVLFDPWIGARDPVILIPGILGTELWREGEKIWPNIGRMLVDRGDEFMDVLAMNADGSPVDGQVHVGDIIRAIDAPVLQYHYFDRLIDALKEQGYVEDKDLFVFPYDWRLDLAESGLQLEAFVGSVLRRTDRQKVDIVAHSMGGLVAKQFIVADEDVVDTMVFVGTPHLGAPVAAKKLLFGDNLGVFGILNPEEIKKIGRNMKSIYQLLPTPAYISTVGHYIVDLADRVFPDYVQTKTFLADRGLNEGHLEAAATGSFATLDLPATVKAFNIVGCETPTMGEIIRRNQGKDEDEYYLRYISGDGTVPFGSADALRVPAANRFYVKGANHSTMTSDEGVRSLVAGIVSGHIRPEDIPGDITQEARDCQLPRGRIVSVHSPVNLHIYDAAGNHVGPGADGAIDMNIPGVLYENIDNNKFVFLPEAGEDYRVGLEATGTGTFSLRVANLEDGAVEQTAYFHAIPIISASRGDVQIAPLSEPEEEGVVLQLDYEGNNQFATIRASAVLDALSSLDTITPVTSAVVTPVGGTQQYGAWFNGPVEVVLYAHDDMAGVLRTEYSLDEGGTWQVYGGPILLQREGVTLRYRSVDRAGNIEEAQAERVRIDLSPPSAVVAFDPLTERIEISGVDTFSTTTISRVNTNTIRILDAVHHATEVRLKELHDERTHMGRWFVEIIGIRYNDGVWQKPPENQLYIERRRDEKNGSHQIQAAAHVKNMFHMVGRYTARTNETILWEKDAMGTAKEIGRTPGIHLPAIATNGFAFIPYSL